MPFSNIKLRFVRYEFRLIFNSGYVLVSNTRVICAECESGDAFEQAWSVMYVYVRVFGERIVGF